MRLLLLAGTAEARQIAAALGDERSITVIASLAGATRSPRPLGVATRIGGFGGREGFAAYLRQERIDAVLDATHPFSARISRRSAEICAEMGVAYRQVLRPPWSAVAEDDWRCLDDEREAARHIPVGARVFVATGRKSLAGLSNLSGRYLICRQIDPPEAPFPLPEGEFLLGRPPFSVADEEELFHHLRVDWLIVKNAGGSASRAKLDAARNLGLPVAMIRRPPQPEGPKLRTVAEAMGWVRSLP